MSGLLDERKAARDYLDELLLICHGRPTFHGGWRITLDTQPTYADIHIRDGMGEGEQNLVTPQSRSFRETKDQISVYRLEHRWDYIKHEYTQTKARPVWINGIPKIYSSNFLRDGVSADKVLNRLALEEQYASEELEGELSPEATPIRENQIARATYAGLGLAGEHYRIQKITRQIGTFPVILRRWHPNIYTYVAAPIDGDPLLGNETEGIPEGAPTVPPTIVTGIGVSSSGVDMGTDGGTSAWIDFAFTAPTDNVAGVRLDVRRASSAGYQQGYAIVHYAGGAVGIRAAQLVPGMAYDFRLVAFNSANEAGPAATLSTTAPSDASIPSTPTNVTLYASQNRTLLITMDPPPPADRDLKGYEFQVRNAANGGGTQFMSGTMPVAALTGTGASNPAETISYTNLGDATPYYLRLRAFDYSNNFSPWTTGAANPSFSFAIPAAPSSLSISGRGMEQGNDGGTEAWIMLQYTLPLLNCVGSRVDFKKGGRRRGTLAWPPRTAPG